MRDDLLRGAGDFFEGCGVIFFRGASCGLRVDRVRSEVSLIVHRLVTHYDSACMTICGVWGVL